MNESMAEHRFAVAVVMGVLLAILFVLALLAASVWRLVWNWVDEGEKPIERNQILAWLYARAGYKPFGFGYTFTKKNGRPTDGAPAWMLPCLGLLLGPTIVLTLFVLYEVTLAALVLYVVAHTARFARRTMKALKKHIADPSAHKEAK